MNKHILLNFYNEIEEFVWGTLFPHIYTKRVELVLASFARKWVNAHFPSAKKNQTTETASSKRVAPIQHPGFNVRGTKRGVAENDDALILPDMQVVFIT